MDREWTDKRMDDFADRVGRFEGDVKERFDKVDEHFDRFESSVENGFDRVERRLDTMTWAIFGSTATIIAVLIAQILFG